MADSRNDERPVTLADFKALLQQSKEGHDTFNMKLSRLEYEHAVRSFNTKVLVQGKALLTVIDHELEYNVVGESMVKKLGLFTIPHPTPYKLSFMKERANVEVTKRAVVSFSFHTYHVTIICDVVPL